MTYIVCRKTRKQSNFHYFLLSLHGCARRLVLVAVVATEEKKRDMRRMAVGEGKGYYSGEIHRGVEE